MNPVPNHGGSTLRKQSSLAGRAAAGQWLAVAIALILGLPVCGLVGIWMWNAQSLPYSGPSYRLTIRRGAEFVQRLKVLEEVDDSEASEPDRRACLSVRVGTASPTPVLLEQHACYGDDSGARSRMFRLVTGPEGKASLILTNSATVSTVWRGATEILPQDLSSYEPVEGARAKLRSGLASASAYGYAAEFKKQLEEVGNPFPNGCAVLKSCKAGLSPSLRWVLVAGSEGGGYSGGGGFFDLSRLYRPYWKYENSTLGLVDSVEGTWKLLLEIANWQGHPSFSGEPSVYWVSDDQLLILETAAPLQILWVDLRAETAPVAPAPATASAATPQGTAIPVQPLALQRDGVRALREFEERNSPRPIRPLLRERTFQNRIGIPRKGYDPRLVERSFVRRSTRVFEGVYECNWVPYVDYGFVTEPPAATPPTVAFQVSGISTIPGASLSTEPAAVRCNGQPIRLRAKLPDELPSLGQFQLGVALSTAPEIRLTSRVYLHEPEEWLTIRNVSAGKREIRFHAQFQLAKAEDPWDWFQVALGASPENLLCAWWIRPHGVSSVGIATAAAGGIHEADARCRGAVYRGNPNIWLSFPGGDLSTMNLYRSDPRSGADSTKARSWIAVPVDRRTTTEFPAIAQVSPGALFPQGGRVMVHLAAPAGELQGTRVQAVLRDDSSRWRCGLWLQFRKGGVHRWEADAAPPDAASPEALARPGCTMEGEAVKTVYPGLYRVQFRVSDLASIGTGTIAVQAFSRDGGPSFVRYVSVMAP